MKRSLRVLVDDLRKVTMTEQFAQVQAGLPKAWGVTYAAPNPDGSRKICSNCMMWVSTTTQCVVHEKSLPVSNEQICGYHIFGQPMKKWTDHPGMMPLDPKYSGLAFVRGGTSCDVCKWFGAKPGEPLGTCYAVLDNDSSKYATVHAKGCCARWEAPG